MSAILDENVLSFIALILSVVSGVYAYLRSVREENYKMKFTGTDVELFKILAMMFTILPYGVAYIVFVSFIYNEDKSIVMRNFAHKSGFAIIILILSLFALKYCRENGIDRRKYNLFELLVSAGTLSYMVVALFSIQYTFDFNKIIQYFISALFIIVMVALTLYLYDKLCFIYIPYKKDLKLHVQYSESQCVLADDLIKKGSYFKIICSNDNVVIISEDEFKSATAETKDRDNKRFLSEIVKSVASSKPIEDDKINNIVEKAHDLIKSEIRKL